MKARVLQLNVDPSDPLATGESLHAALLPLIVRCTSQYPDLKGKAAVLAGFLAGFCGSATGELGANAVADLLDMLSSTLRSQADALDSQNGRAH